MATIKIISVDIHLIEDDALPTQLVHQYHNKEEGYEPRTTHPASTADTGHDTG